MTPAGVAGSEGFPSPRVVIGIDPSLTATGIAWADGSTSTVKGGEGDTRLVNTYDGITRACCSPMSIVSLRVDLAVVEDLPTGAHGAGKTGMAQGIVRLALRHVGVPYVLIPAATLKKFATGNGGAGKPDMRMELFKRTGLDLRDDNQVDAWWLREMGLHALGHPSIDLPKTHTVALAKVTWPARDVS